MSDYHQANNNNKQHNSMHAMYRLMQKSFYYHIGLTVFTQRCSVANKTHTRPTIVLRHTLYTR